MRCFLLFCLVLCGVQDLRSAEDNNPPPEDPNGPSWMEVSGQRFRRLRLDGVPMPAEKDQAKDESDEESEESYIDSLTQALRHDTSDIYIPLPGGELSFAVKRSNQSEVWEKIHGEQPVHWVGNARPFGLGWSSGLCPNVKMESHSGSGELPHDGIEVTDENGAVYKFAKIYNRDSADPEDPDAANEGGVDGKIEMSFLPLPNNRTATDSFRNRLTAVYGTSGGQRVLEKLVLTRKFGTRLTFAPQPVWVSNVALSNTQIKRVWYFRLVSTDSVVDRFGNRLDYAYPDAASVIPSTITWRDAQGTGAKTITIQSSVTGGRRLVNSVTDPRGNTWQYQYTSSTYGFQSFDLLSSVTPPAGGKTLYTYDMPTGATDTRPVAPGSTDPSKVYYQVAVNSFTVGGTGGGMVRMPGGSSATWTGPARTTNIVYDKDDTTLAYDPPSGTYFNPWPSRPRMVVGTQLSDGSSATFTDSGDPIALHGSGTGEGLEAQWHATGVRQVTSVDAIGTTRVIKYDQPRLVDSSEIEDLFYGKTGDDLRNPFVAILWGRCQLTHPDSVKETAEFDTDAALADKKVTDYSGNVTEYEHADGFKASWFIPWLPPTLADHPLLSPKYGDPTKETRLLPGGSPVVKQFQYYSSGHNGADYSYHLAPASRVMTQIIDPLGRVTDYVVDPATGRRESETIRASAGGTIAKLTEFAYADARFPGFVTGTTVRNAVRDNGTVMDLVTTSTADAGGNQATSTIDPGGLNLTTTSVSDANGNKTSSTDARGATTTFAYDQANRLITTTLPAATLADGSTQAAVVLETGYTPTGRVFWKSDERGTVALTERDLRRRVAALYQMLPHDAGFQRGSSPNCTMGS